MIRGVNLVIGINQQPKILIRFGKDVAKFLQQGGQLLLLTRRGITKTDIVGITNNMNTLNGIEIENISCSKMLSSFDRERMLLQVAY